ncbi:hypothetical protein GCM10025876_20690 [Demequina litorisediminis]|uniref:Uncharacterized protein n=1 Tax=Demequina litorisediminis TaxID=1849022 RepID=A0ABQ6IF07_9MICO|nr:hypothetical protein GCM10025876_20690 [Demequina litorisediminis]
MRCPTRRSLAGSRSPAPPTPPSLCPRTPADRKGGHLAIRKADGQLILRDTAQTAPEEMDYFTDEFRHPFFHTNNLWFDLVAIKKALTERGAVLGLPLIRNEKTVDPTDGDSPKVYQARVRHGCGHRGVRGCHRHRGGPRALPAREDHQRPAAAAFGCLRAWATMRGSASPWRRHR